MDNLILNPYKPCLYIIQCNDYYKVGHTTDINSRFNSIQTSNPFEIKLVHRILFENQYESRVAEKISHQKLIDNGFHFSREWFVGDLSAIVNICELSSIFATSQHLLKQNTQENKALHVLRFVNHKILSDITKIQESRLAEILNGNRMHKNEILLLNIFWGNSDAN